MNNENTPQKRGRFGLMWRTSKAFLMQSLSFIGDNKDLIWLPVLSFVLSIVLVLATIGGIIFGIPKGPDSLLFSILSVAVAYGVIAFVVLFIHSWLISCVYKRLAGEPGRLSEGYRATVKRIPQIIAWALVSATVGLLLQLIESFNDLIGDIVAAVLGFAWGLAVYFVIPVIIVDGCGPFAAIKKSSTIFGKNWRKMVNCYFWLSAVFLIAIVLVYAIEYVDPPLLKALNPAIYIPLIIVFLIAASFFSRLFNAIVQSALYLYYVEKKVPKGFDEALLKQAFCERRRSF
jgi:hypothetical protein